MARDVVISLLRCLSLSCLQHKISVYKRFCRDKGINYSCYCAIPINKPNTSLCCFFLHVSPVFYFPTLSLCTFVFLSLSLVALLMSLYDFIVIFVCSLAQMQSTQISIKQSYFSVASIFFFVCRLSSLHFKYNPNNINMCSVHIAQQMAKPMQWSKATTKQINAKWNFTNIFNLNYIPNFMFRGPRVCVCMYAFLPSSLFTPTISVSHSLLRFVFCFCCCWPVY